MGTYGLKKILTVGKGTDLYPFIRLFKSSGIEVKKEENIKIAVSVAQEFKPDAILFVLPRYWTEITVFVQEIRKISEFEHTPIVYVGSLIEGVDQQILRESGVHTLTFGPVPVEEMARYVMHKMTENKPL